MEYSQQYKILIKRLNSFVIGSFGSLSKSSYQFDWWNVNAYTHIHRHNHRQVVRVSKCNICKILNSNCVYDAN